MEMETLGKNVIYIVRPAAQQLELFMNGPNLNLTPTTSSTQPSGKNWPSPRLERLSGY